MVWFQNDLNVARMMSGISRMNQYFYMKMKYLCSNQPNGASRTSLEGALSLCILFSFVKKYSIDIKFALLVVERQFNSITVAILAQEKENVWE